MIFMPLIDEADTLLDANLMADLSLNFSVDNGLIIDTNGKSWVRWRSDGIDSWWRFFEETIDKPMGRRLANAACDEEENLLSAGYLDKTGMFKKKKILQAIEHRWWLHGWGRPNLKPPSFQSNVLTPIISGILQAQIERIDGKRYRMRWEQKSSDSCILSLEDSNQSIPQSNSVGKTYSSSSPYSIDVESDWKIDGLSHHLLPAGLFIRLQESCAGLIANIGEDERNSWPVLGDGFLSLAIASKKLFIAGEEIFLAADADGWMESCNTLLAPKGLSSPVEVKSIDSNGGVSMKFTELPLPAITTGFIAGAWVRCEGRPVKVGLEMGDDFIEITLQSRYEIS